MNIDIIIPCFNAEKTLERAVVSALNQTEVRRVYLIDDASKDRSWDLIQLLKQKYPQICAERLYENGGVARARNWGAWQSDADIIGFLDADDAYQDNALAAAYFAFQKFHYLGLIRLRLQAVNLASRYVQHQDLAHVWHILQMTVGGNTLFRRNFFLACGGFPQDNLFRVFGGEDGALGLATVSNSVVATLFDETEAGVLHYCREGMHAERLLDAYLFNKHDERINTENIMKAQEITDKIKSNLWQLRQILNVEKTGTMPLLVSRLE